MPNFVYDAVSLAFPKLNLLPVPIGANPAQYFSDTDWNTACQSLVDIKGALREARYFGYTPFAADPAPGVTAYTWVRSSDGAVMYHRPDNVTVKLLTDADSLSATQIRGVTVSATAPTTNQVLQYNGTLWLPVTLSTPPSGAAGGDLAGSYPNPVLATINPPAGTYGSSVQIPVLTVDAKGRVTAASQVAAIDRAQINSQTGTSYTFVIGDEGLLVICTNASTIAATVPPNSSVAFSVGTRIDVAQGGAGKVTLTQGAGVTINSKSSNKSTNGQYVGVSLVKTATDTWLLFGDLQA